MCGLERCERRVRTNSAGSRKCCTERFGALIRLLHNQASPYRQTVILTAANLTAHVVLKVGPKPGVLVLTVSDHTTGKAVEGFMVGTFGAEGLVAGGGRADFPQTTEADWEVPVSRLFDVLLGVTAKGYKSWFYSNPADPSDPTLHLGSGERKDVQVTMQPK